MQCQVHRTSRKENFLSIIATGSNINNCQKNFAKKMIKITVCEWKNSTVNKIKKFLFHNQPKSYIKLTYFNFYSYCLSFLKTFLSKRRDIQSLTISIINPFKSNWSFLVPPKMISKPEIFWCFQGESKEISGI